MQEVLAALDNRLYPTLGWLEEFECANGELHTPRTLSVEEERFARAFFGFVGTSDLEGQLMHIEQYAERAQEQWKVASDRRQRLAKVYLSTAMCAGLGVGIVML